MRAGFIGLGHMGTRIVDAMLAGGVDTTLWARREASVEPFVPLGAKVAASPAELAKDCDVIGLCVWDESDIADVMLRADGILAGVNPGCVIAIHSTISPDACRRFADEANRFGAAVVDAPVSVGNREDRVVVMLGGDEAAVERARPVLESFGEPVAHLGPLGSGQLAKLVNNVTLAAQIALGGDAIEFGAALGLDRDELFSVLSHSSSRGTWTGLYGAIRAVGAGRTMEWAKKDVGLTIETAQNAGIDINRIVLELGQAGAGIVAATRTA
ncbi:MAG: NAD(P)-dependent oxidoreductase [Acidimicrobiia bacterium]